jgi:hypothetical protein
MSQKCHNQTSEPSCQGHGDLPNPEGLLPHFEANATLSAKPSFDETPVSSRNICAMRCLHEALQPVMITFVSREVHADRLRRS